MIGGASFRAEEAVLVGDTTHDYEVANAIGAQCILMPGGHHSKAKLQASGAVVMESPGEALDYILS
jgi:phosphoglycolate phosphatase